VDGVLRKASSYIAKTVHQHKNKKLDIETFLCKDNKGIIDTDMHVAPLSETTVSKGDGPETVGTMELRLFVTRQLGVSHSLGDIKTYNNTKGNVEDDEEVGEAAMYKQLAPEFQMAFEMNAATLERSKLLREQRKITARRPGTEPWAIFRFHYRSIGQLGLLQWIGKADVKCRSDYRAESGPDI
jgi:hypothetical protein